MENKQTAIEWFINELESKGDAWENTSIERIQISIKVSDYLELKKQANKMFEEQIKEAYNRGKSAGWFTANQLAEPKHNSAEEYYEQTYIINQQYDKEENK